MVLDHPRRWSRREGSGVRARALRGGRAAERGSQALEFALVLPAVSAIVALVLLAGMMGAELVLAQGIAREAARAAAVGDDVHAQRLARAAAGPRRVDVRLRPPHDRRERGDLVTAEVRLRSAVLDRLGVQTVLRARATMQVEGR